MTPPRHGRSQRRYRIRAVSVRRAHRAGDGRFVEADDLNGAQDAAWELHKHTESDVEIVENVPGESEPQVIWRLSARWACEYCGSLTDDHYREACFR
jgi:hypothetical protein